MQNLTAIFGTPQGVYSKNNVKAMTEVIGKKPVILPDNVICICNTSNVNMAKIWYMTYCRREESIGNLCSIRQLSSYRQFIKLDQKEIILAFFLFYVVLLPISVYISTSEILLYKLVNMTYHKCRFFFILKNPYEWYIIKVRKGKLNNF